MNENAVDEDDDGTGLRVVGEGMKEAEEEEEGW